MNTPGHSVLTGRAFPQRPEASLHVRSPGDRSTGRGSDLRTRPSPVADAASVRQAALSCAAEPRCPRARDTAPSALPVDTGQILCLSTGAPHSPRHPAGDPECPPHIRARRLVFRCTHASPSGRNSGGGGSPRGWVQILARALATGGPHRLLTRFGPQFPSARWG